jgi:diguanylate cyclase (GGDEF)-like protein/PAS domain S-box-containing protein
VELTAINPDRTGSRIPELRQLLQVALALTLVEVATGLLNLRSWHNNGVTILWPSNGLLIGVLLSSRRRQWPSYFVIAAAIDIAVSIFMIAEPFKLAAYDAACNMLEAGLAAALLYPSIARRPNFNERRQLVRLALFAVILAPAIASLLAQLYLPSPSPLVSFVAFNHWFLPDALGNAIMIPLYLSLRKGSPFVNRSRKEVFGLFTLLSIVAIAVFSQTEFPGLFLLTPCLLVLGFRLRLAGSATGLLLIAEIGGFYTVEGRGPLALMRHSTNVQRDIGLQAFIALSMLLLYSVDLVVAEIAQRQASLKESETRFRLLAEASNDIIVLTDLEDRRRYVSPAVSTILGWAPEELLDRNFDQLVHPEDLERFSALTQQCRRGEPCAALSYRCQCKDGTYLWMEASIRLCRNEETGEPIGFVKVVRDISSRKAAEDELNLAFSRAANMAMMDSLTGVANRRQFDEIMAIELRRARRDGSTLSLLMIDVDYFKSYNDLYGHIQGDACLREIAHAIQAVIHRMTDLFARYGGEEFVAILPNTDSRGAQLVAEQIRSAVENLNIPHAASLHHVVTVSIGCATHTMTMDVTGNPLLQAADAALYQAKSADRNRIEVGDTSAMLGQL